ncbi:MAG TPA: triose-phosphate isomerase [Acidimicrobiia bacterium]|nr:triose-phosphate isomerase [Acidimicrobiia bacterium]
MTDRTPLIVGNWKMNASHLEAIQMIQKLSYRLEADDYQRVDIVVAPPFTSLRSVQVVLEQDHIPIALGAQDVFWAESGAFTGEISAPMLAKLTVRHVIVGHSERRQHFGETDETVNKKAKAVVAAGMAAIVCVGETLEEREADQAQSVVSGQVTAGLRGLQLDDPLKLSIAYEPVWAIGTGRTAFPDDAATVASAIREQLRSLFNSEVGEQVRILYGGSVNAVNIKDFMAKKDIDGALVGGASLDPDQFATIVRYRL